MTLYEQHQLIYTKIRPNFFMRKELISCVLLVLLAGCYEKKDSPTQLKILSEITKQAPGLMSLKDIAGNQWSRVCFFGPYTLKSTDVLGFDWEVTNKTAIGGDDTNNVIVFATDKKVTQFVIVPRGKADFWKLSRQCFPRNEAVFYYEQKVWSYLHKNT